MPGPAVPAQSGLSSRRQAMRRSFRIATLSMPPREAGASQMIEADFASARAFGLGRMNHMSKTAARGFYRLMGFMEVETCAASKGALLSGEEGV